MAGFFGKLPASGDFVARGLGPGVRPALDRWLTLGPARLLAPSDWPDRGLRALLAGPSGPLALTILPSQDASGRRFPLAACSEGAADPQTIDTWAEAILPDLFAASVGGIDAGTLASCLSATAPEVGDGIAPLLWTRTLPPAAPDDVLATLMKS